MRKKLVVGNWKMNMTRAQASAAMESLTVLLDPRVGVEVVVCPPYLAIATVSQLLRSGHFRVGAQDVFWMPGGAFTGNISAGMLADAGCGYCIVGHSETRGRFGKLEVPRETTSYFGESDQTVNLKLKALLYQSIHPILCVGETLEEREAGKTDEIIGAQIKGALEGIEGAEFFSGVVAYEPVWAIGTGKTCDPSEANRVCGFIRSCLAKVLDPDTASAIRILYGGSVKPSNARELFEQSEIDGGLVGGASLNPDEFAEIVQAA